MEIYGLPPIGQIRPMDGAQLHPPWVVYAGGRFSVYQEWKTKNAAATRQTPAAAWFQRRCSPK
jgi:hypothetical protein